jgi:hypothetical protein
MTAKLYWRYKKEGKWTWRPVQIKGSYTEFWKKLDELGITLWDIETKLLGEQE